ncbi:hypothetical protein LINPERPRIM_LOCUS6030, partial [Linum perenne]
RRKISRVKKEDLQSEEGRSGSGTWWRSSSRWDSGRRLIEIRQWRWRSLVWFSIQNIKKGFGLRNSSMPMTLIASSKLGILSSSRGPDPSARQELHCYSRTP